MELWINEILIPAEKEIDDEKQEDDGDAKQTKENLVSAMKVFEGVKNRTHEQLVAYITKTKKHHHHRDSDQWSEVARQLSASKSSHRKAIADEIRTWLAEKFTPAEKCVNGQSKDGDSSAAAAENPAAAAVCPGVAQDSGAGKKDTEAQQGEHSGKRGGNRDGRRGGKCSDTAQRHAQRQAQRHT